MAMKDELDLEQTLKTMKNLTGLGLGDEDIIKLLGIEPEEYEEIKKRV